MVIMCTIVILFVLILCVACIKKRGDDEDEHEDIRRQFEQEEESEAEEEEEEEDPITLNEEDYDRFFPVIDTEIENKDKKLQEEICSICIDKILNDEKVRKIRFCTHFFHSGCLQDWIKVNESCPNCKLELDRKNMLKLEKLAEPKKSSNRIGLIDPDKKRLPGSPGSSSEKLKKRHPEEAEGPYPSRLRNFSRSQLENVNEVQPREIHITR